MLELTCNLIVIDILGEIEELNNRVKLSTSTIKELELRVLNAETLIQNLHVEKTQLVKINESHKSELEIVQRNFEVQEEEQSEIRQRLENKNRECENLLFNLRESQAQLSMCQIKIQQVGSKYHILFSPLTIYYNTTVILFFLFQLSAGESTAPSSQFVEFQNENATLKGKIQELEKLLDASNSEKEQSSQNFHVYAQHCNSQLSTANAQVMFCCF